jgi:hypothetical protein
MVCLATQCHCHVQPPSTELLQTRSCRPLQDNVKKLQQAIAAYDYMSDDEHDSPPSSPHLPGSRVASGGRAGGRRGGGSKGLRDGSSSHQGHHAQDFEAPGSLAAKLSDLGRKLLAEIEGSGPGSPRGSGGHGAGRVPRYAAATGASGKAAGAGAGAGAGGKGGKPGSGVSRGSKGMV